MEANTFVYLPDRPIETYDLDALRKMSAGLQANIDWLKLKHQYYIKTKHACPLAHRIYRLRDSLEQKMVAVDTEILNRIYGGY